MAFTFTKYVPMLIAAASASGTGLSHNWNQQWLYTSGNYNGTVAVYLEADIYVNNSSYTGTLRLYDSSSNAVTDAAVTTTATGTTRVRSGNIAANLVNGTTYHIGYQGNHSSCLMYIKNARLVIVQVGSVTKTEQYISLMLAEATTTGTDYADMAANTYFTLNTSDEFNGTLSYYFEAVLYTSNTVATAYARLVESDGDAVTDAEVSSNSSNTVRVRSGAISLTNGTTYKAQCKRSGTTGTMYIRAVRLIIVQSDMTKTACYNHVMFGGLNTTSTSYQDALNYFLWDDDEWTDATKVVYHEGAIKSSNSGVTMSLQLAESDGTEVNTVTSSATVTTMVRSGSLTMTDIEGLKSLYKSGSLGHTCTIYGHALVVLVTVPSGGGGGGGEGGLFFAHG